MVIKQDLTDKEIEKYHSLITIKSLFKEKENKFIWMVCCKECGGELMPYIKDMEKEKVDEVLKEHQHLEIKGYEK